MVCRFSCSTSRTTTPSTTTSPGLCPSTRTLGEFAALLRRIGITLVVAVRSIPRSRAVPQFNADTQHQNGQSQITNCPALWSVA